MADIEEERLTLLLAVVRHVDTCGDLLQHDIAHCLLADAVQFRSVNRLAARTADIEPSQRRRTGQAASVGS